MRLVGEDGIFTVSKANVNKKDDETDHSIAIERGRLDLCLKLSRFYTEFIFQRLKTPPCPPLCCSSGSELEGRKRRLEGGRGDWSGEGGGGGKTASRGRYLELGKI